MPRHTYVAQKYVARDIVSIHVLCCVCVYVTSYCIKPVILYSVLFQRSVRVLTLASLIFFFVNQALFMLCVFLESNLDYRISRVISRTGV